MRFERHLRISLEKLPTPLLHLALRARAFLLRWYGASADLDLDDLVFGTIEPADAAVQFPGLHHLRLFGQEWLSSAHSQPVLLLIGVPPALQGLISQFYRDRRVAAFRARRNVANNVRALLGLRRAGCEVVVPHSATWFGAVLRVPSRRIDWRLWQLEVTDEPLAYPLTLTETVRGRAGRGTPSRSLETVLNELAPPSDAARRAVEAQVERLIGNDITLQRGGSRPLDARILGPRVRRRVLVAGAPSGAFGRFGFRGTGADDLRLVDVAVKENKDADIVFLPAMSSRTTSASPPPRFRHDVKVVSPDTSPAAILREVDHVYVAEADLGFDALLRGLPVTTVGRPFFAGWGLTSDRRPVGKRAGSLTLAELCVGLFHEHLRYIADAEHPASGLDGTLSRVIGFRDRTYTPRTWPRQQHFVEFTRIENVAADLAVAQGDESETVSPPAAAILSAVRAGDDLFRRVCEQYSTVETIRLLVPLVDLLVRRVDFDKLRETLRSYCRWFETIDDVAVDAATGVRFLGGMIYGLKSLNGRHIARMPSYPDLDRLSYPDFKRVLPALFRLYVLNTEYERATTLLDARPIADRALLLRLTDVMGETPQRSERDGYARARLRATVTDRTLAEFDQAFGNVNGLMASRILVSRHLDNHRETAHYAERLAGLLEARSAASRSESQHLRSLTPILSYLAATGHAETARKLAHFVLPHASLGARAVSQVQFDVHTGQRDAAIQKVERIPDGKARNLTIRLLFDQNLFGPALSRHSKAVSSGRSYKLGSEKQKDRLEFIARTSQILNAVPQPLYPKAMVMVASLGCLNTMAMIAPVLVELKRMGYAVQHLSAGMMENLPVNDLAQIGAANALAGTIPRGNSDRTVKLEWYIDWDARIVESQGINFYQGLYERLSNRFRCFHVNLSDPEVAGAFQRYLEAMDYVLRTCLSIEEALVRQGVPVVLIGSNSHVAPYSVFRDFCLARNKPTLRFSSVNVAYENYYTNLGSKFSGSMAVVDMTLHRTCRAPFLAIPERFERWYAANRDAPAIAEKVNALLYANRNQGTERTANPTADRLRAARRGGKRVICCFGKILCDLAVPYDGGPGHSDIVDWIRHTVECVRGREDTILLVKPHPHELRPEIALDLAEYFADVLPKDLPENVVVLGHREFNVHEIAEHIDLAVLWNGTSSLELTALGLPVMMCSDFGRHDYPVELLYPESRDGYRDFLLTGAFAKPDDEARRRAMALLHYMGTEDVALPNAYSRRQSTNDSVGMPTWNEAALARFLRDGDPVMALAAKRAVEGIEARR